MGQAPALAWGLDVPRMRQEAPGPTHKELSFRPMDRPRRRWRIHLDIEGDSWELAGKAFTKAMHLLMSGNHSAIEREDKPYHALLDIDGCGFALEVSVDPKMTPDVYAELKDAWKRFREKVSGSEP